MMAAPQDPDVTATIPGYLAARLRGRDMTMDDYATLDRIVRAAVAPMEPVDLAEPPVVLIVPASTARRLRNETITVADQRLLWTLVTEALGDV